MTRKDFQKLIQKKRIFQYEVASAIGISEFTLCRWLRNPSAEQEQKIIAAVGELSQRR